MSLDKLLIFNFCYFLCGAFKIVSAESVSTDFEKVSQVLACCKPGRVEKQQRFLLSYNSWQVAPGLLVDGKNEPGF